MDKMQQWRDGLLSDAEIMEWLISYMVEVQISMKARETDIAEGILPSQFRSA